MGSWYTVVTTDLPLVYIRTSLAASSVDVSEIGGSLMSHVQTAQIKPCLHDCKASSSIVRGKSAKALGLKSGRPRSAEACHAAGLLGVE